MEALTVASRLVLVAVFTVAGVAKLVDPVGFKNGLSGFGVPFGLHRQWQPCCPGLSSNE